MKTNYFLTTIIISLFCVCGFAQTNYTVPWTSTAVSNQAPGGVATYTLSANNAVGTDATILAGSTYTVNFPTGTNVSTYTNTGSTFNGTAIASSTTDVPNCRVTFVAPTAAASAAPITVILAGITNPTQSATPYTTLNMTAPNTSVPTAGTNTFNNSSYYIYAISPAPVSWTTTTVANSDPAAVTTYSLTATNPTGPTYNIPVGANVVVTFPASTNVAGYTSVGSTFNGFGFSASINQTARTVSFPVPAGGGVASGAAFTVVINGIRNLPVGSTADITTLTMTAKNASMPANTGVNTFNTSAYLAYSKNYTVPWTSVVLSNPAQSAVSNYTLTAFNPAGPVGSAATVTPTCCSYIPGTAGDSVIIIFPTGTNASTFTSGTFNGSPISGQVVTATSIRFIAPASVNKGTSFQVVLNGITNPSVTEIYHNLKMTVFNGAGGTNIFNASDYAIVCP